MHLLQNSNLNMIHGGNASSIPVFTAEEIDAGRKSLNWGFLALGSVAACYNGYKAISGTQSIMGGITDLAAFGFVWGISALVFNDVVQG